MDISDALERSSGNDRESEVIREVGLISCLLGKLTSEEGAFLLCTQLFLLAQAYYNLVEAMATSPVGWVDVNLNRTYLAIVKGIKHHLTLPELQDFPGGFEPVADNLFPGSEADLDWMWDDCYGPAARDFLHRAQVHQIKSIPIVLEHTDVIEKLLVPCQSTCETACQVALDYRMQAREAFEGMIKNEQRAQAHDAGIGKSKTKNQDKKATKKRRRRKSEKPTPKQAEAYRLIEIEGLTQQEAAIRMGCSKQNVSRLYNEAAAKLGASQSRSVKPQQTLPTDERGQVNVGDGG